MKKILLIFFVSLSIKSIAQQDNKQLVRLKDMYSESFITFRINTDIFIQDEGAVHMFNAPNSVKLIVMGAMPTDVGYKEASKNIRKNKKSPPGDNRKWQFFEGGNILYAIEYYTADNIQKATLHYAKYPQDDRVIYFLIHVNAHEVNKWKTYFDDVLMTVELKPV